MPVSPAARLALGALLTALSYPALAACPDPARGIGVARIVEVDTTGGPVFGFITKQAREKSFLAPREVVLTFDDGPMPGITRSILDTLDQFCTKATFFSVGRMAAAYPDSVREILKRGHTLGTHTWSHPMSLPRLSQKQAKDQIEAGFAAVSTAAGQPIAPFFRFPGLNDSAALIRHLADRNIATFTVDVVSNDSYIADPARLTALTLERLEAENGGIMLFHDIKHQTARALPGILAEMRRRGYKVVHLTAKHPFATDPAYVAAVSDHVAAKKIGPQRPALVAVTEAPAAPSPAPAPGAAADAPAEIALADAPPLIVEVMPPRTVDVLAAAAASRVSLGQVAEAADPAIVLRARRRAAPATQEATQAKPEEIKPMEPKPVMADAQAAPALPAFPAKSDAPAVAVALPAAIEVEPTLASVSAPPPARVSAVPAKPAPVQAPVTAQKPPAGPAPAAVAKPPVNSPAAASAEAQLPAATTQIEVVAGTYPPKVVSGVPTIISAGPQAPSVIAGTYGPPRAAAPAVPRRPDPTWQDSLTRRLGEGGN